jgi:hypothetical protein
MIKILAKSDSAFDHIEVARCRKIDFRDASGSQYQLTDTNCDEILIDGWMTPDPRDTFGIRPIEMDINKRDEIANLETIITVLVNMMGGAVTIGKSEADESLKYKLTNEMQRDPLMFILRTEPKLYIP